MKIKNYLIKTSYFQKILISNVFDLIFKIILYSRLEQMEQILGYETLWVYIMFTGITINAVLWPHYIQQMICQIQQRGNDLHQMGQSLCCLYVFNKVNSYIIKLHNLYLFFQLTSKLSSLVWSTTSENARKISKLPNDQFVDAVNEAFVSALMENNIIFGLISSLIEIVTFILQYLNIINFKLDIVCHLLIQSMHHFKTNLVLGQ